MTNARRLLRLALFVAAAAALVAAAMQLREQRVKVGVTVRGIEDQLAELDPLTRAEVVARLGADAAKEVKSQVQHQAR